MKTLTSIGPANRIARSEETHPLTWRLRDDCLLYTSRCV